MCFFNGPTPCLRQQTSDGRCSHCREEGAPVNGAKVRDETQLIEAIRRHGEASNLTQTKAHLCGEVARLYQQVEGATDLRRLLENGTEFGCV